MKGAAQWDLNPYRRPMDAGALGEIRVIPRKFGTCVHT